MNPLVSGIQSEQSEQENCGFREMDGYPVGFWVAGNRTKSAEGVPGVAVPSGRRPESAEC
ncbi:hypothetical protein AWI75_14380 [Listeria monocytogenes]|nr:hypothetical protein AWI75_14380 [Listeria monocytogenes]